ncbi:putative MFS transporter Fmp42 [Aspergillus vadensis CBS 113365]|uniref:MFS transporter Fmp42 n=1 Tax=Aspergillus vadensis (strain CBS 113365 / IMI 142717 / IBT 24658) TaxID=1448311 RepID=A0A319B1R9_ASPVC|nr:MFS transporter Fmp42 [Aspergillus vadensis CBS 113365]PYH64120.1 MFS transporter Fmp42 [Aspergillus vadensis CBS 113365]
MSLNRISFLESWEQNPAAFRRQPRPEDSDDEDRYHDLPEPSLSSSFQSNISSRPPFRDRLNFNPYAGPGWNETFVDEPDRPYRGLSPRRLRADEAEPLEQPEEDNTLRPQQPAGLETTGAFEVSRWKRILQVCIAVVYCLLSAGVVFGFAAIKPIFVKEGVYRNLCSKDELDSGSDVCYRQDIRLNLMFTVAAVATNVSALPVGAILDTHGPRVCGIIGSICLTVGSLLLGLAPKFSFDAYLPGYLFLSLGGPFIFVPSYQLSNTFPTHSGLILSTLTGAFDASSALFLVFRLVNEKTDGAFTTSRFFLIYLVVPIFILTAQLTVMPTTSYKTAGELVQQAEAHIVAEAADRVDEAIDDRNEGERQRNDRRLQRQTVINQIEDLLHAPAPEQDLQSQLEAEQQTATIPHTAGGVWGALHGRSALQQIRTPWFVLITLFTVLQMLRINYFVATIRQQYTYLLDSPERAKALNSTFDVLLPLGGLISVPFTGAILDNARTPVVLGILVITATVIGLLGCIPSILAGYANIILFVIYRPFYYTSVSDYSSKVFGFQTFGKVYGLIICLAGLGNFAQTGLDTLVFRVFDRNPIPVNAMLTGITFPVGLALVAYVSWQTKKLAAAKLAQEEAADGANGESGLVAGHDDRVNARDWYADETTPLLGNSIRGRRPSFAVGGPSS